MRIHGAVIALVLGLLSTLATGCGEEAAARRTIRSMDAKTALENSVALQKSAMESMSRVVDEPTARQAATDMDRAARLLDATTDHLETIDPVSINDAVRISFEGLSEIMGPGLGALFKGFQLMGKPKLLKIIDAPQKRFEAAQKRLTDFLRAPR